MKTISETFQTHPDLRPTAHLFAQLRNVSTRSDPLTIFVPPNIPNVPSQVLNQLLSYHVVPLNLSTNDLISQNGQTLTTVNGAPLKILVENGKIYLVDQIGHRSHVVSSDIQTSNGTIHKISHLLVPSSIASVVYNSSNNQLSPSQQSTKTKQNWTWLWIVLAIIAIIIIIYLILKSGKKKHYRTYPPVYPIGSNRPALPIPMEIDYY
jgi:hypothetical protein